MKCRRFVTSSASTSTSRSTISKSLTSSASASMIIIFLLLASLQFLTTNSNAFVIERSKRCTSRSRTINNNVVAVVAVNRRRPLLLKQQQQQQSYTHSSIYSSLINLKLSSDDSDNNKKKDDDDDDDDDKTKKKDTRQTTSVGGNFFPVEDYETFDYKPFLQEGKDFQSSSSVGSTDADTNDIADAIADLALTSLKDNDYNNNNNNNSNNNILTLDESIQARYAATRYTRYDGNYNTSEGRTPSTSNPDVIEKARYALQLAIRAPSGFNVQPYKMVLIHTPSSKLKLSKYCIGRNIDRVLDSDCTIIFLADRQVMRSWNQYKTMIQKQEEESSASKSTTSTSTVKKKKTKWNYLKLRILIGLFSSGYPYLPKLIAGPISWCIRVGMRIVSWCTRSWLVVPTLSSSECWSQKNTALVAMSYMLGCTSRSLVTTPMEGYLSWGIRQSFNISRRYTIPLIISTGIPYTSSNTENENDDTGISHGNTKETSTPRFEYDSIVEEK